MQQTWQTLNDILKSVTKLQADEHHSINSLEIKESAETLSQSLQPCLQELVESSNRLNNHIDNSLKELKQAEAIWLSKARIANADTNKIWQQITILTGLAVKMEQLVDESKKAAVNKSETACKEIFKKLIKKHFYSESQGIKSKIGWGDKAYFLKKIQPQLIFYNNQLDKIIVRELNNFFETLKLIDFKFLFNCYLLYNKSCQKKYLEKTRKTLSKINNAISNPDLIENIYIITVSRSVIPIIENWQEFGNIYFGNIGDIYYGEVVELEKKITRVSVSRIERVISDRLKLATETIEAIITFYSQLLEKQNCYLKETSEQRLAEKDWIDRQKKMLLTLQTELNSIVKY